MVGVTPSGSLRPERITISICVWCGVWYEARNNSVTGRGYDEIACLVRDPTTDVWPFWERERRDLQSRIAGGDVEAQFLTVDWISVDVRDDI